MIRSYLSKFRFYQFLHGAKARLIDIEKRDEIRHIKSKINANKKASIYIFTPTHLNLGDHAIVCATTRLFETAEFDYIEITDKELYILKKYNSLNIFNGRKLLFHGGGYLGTIWLRCEQLAREIVSENPRAKIIFLPNTIYYEDDDFGRSELNKSIQIYNHHNKVVFYARELISYYYMKNIYKEVRICPDMVFSLNMVKNNNTRKGCLICLRNDIEKTISEEDFTVIINQLKAVFNDDYKLTDMYADHEVDITKRNEILEKKFNEFREAELVVTDRLHGMIFSAITGTPCIVIDSKSPKVKGCYEWIKNLEYISFCENYNEISRLANELKKLNNNKYDNSALKAYYLKLLNEIKL